MNLNEYCTYIDDMTQVDKCKYKTISSTHSFHKVNIDKLSSSWQAHPN